MTAALPFVRLIVHRTRSQRHPKLAPYQLFLNYGNQIRARSLAKQTFLSQLTCGTMGYLPTEKAEKGSHYSAFVGSGTTGHQGGDLLVRKTLKEINAMFSDAE